MSPDRCLLSVVSFFIKLTTSLDILEKPGKMIGRGELREQSWKYIESWKIALVDLYLVCGLLVLMVDVHT